MDHHAVEQRYRHALYEECRYLRTEGLEAGPVPLNNVFVMLQALRSERERPEEGRPDLPLSPGRSAHAGLPGRPAPPVPVALSQALQEAQHLVLLGEPGAGKSTTLQFIALCFVHPDGNWANERLKLNEDRIPIHADLRALAPRMREGTSLTEALVPQIRDLAQVEADVARACLRTWRREGRLFLLLDGLDEVTGERETVRLALRRFARGAEGSNCCVVISSRTAGYIDLGRPYREYALRPFGSAEEAAPYVAGWLAALRGVSPTDVKKEIDALLERMEAQKGLARVTDNPLLLRLAISVYDRARQVGTEGEEALARNRAALYEQYVTQVAWTRAEKRITPPLSLPDTLEALEIMAWELMGGERTRGQLADRLREEMRQLEDPHAMVDFCREALGLLAAYDAMPDPHLAFAHLTFREYFVARRLERAWEVDPDAVWEILQSRLYIDAWREPLLLLAGTLEEATALVQRVLRAGSPHERLLRRDLRLAAELVGNGVEVDGKVVEGVVRRLAGMLHPRPAWLQDLMQEERLTWLRCRTGWPPYERVRQEAAETLGQLRDAQALIPLMEALKDKDGGVGRAAAWSLGRLGGAQAVEPLIDALKSENGLVYWETVQALGQLEDVAVTALIGALKAEKKSARWGAAWALGQLGDARAVVPLISLLEDETLIVQWAAARALGQLGDTRAVAPLINALEDEEGAVRQGAMEALGRLGAARALGQLGDARAVPPLIGTLADENLIMGRQVAAALGQLGTAAVLPLIDALKDENGVVRRRAAEALGELGDARAVPPLVDALGDEEGWVRRKAAEALGQLGDGMVGPLIEALADEDEDVRREAAQALGQLGDIRAVVPLVHILEDEYGSVRKSAAQALGQLGDARAVAPLIKRLADRDGNVRWEATKALGQLKDARAVVPLIRALEDKNLFVRWEAARVLGQLEDARAVTPLIDTLEDKDGSVRWGAAEALGQLEDTRAVTPLIDILEDKDGRVRYGVVQSLGQLGDARAIAPLICRLADRDGNVRLGAVKALEKLTPQISCPELAQRALCAFHSRPVEDRKGAAGDAHDALERMVARLEELEVDDPPLLPAVEYEDEVTPRWVLITLSILVVMVGFAAAVFTDLFSSLLGDMLKPRLIASGGIVLILFAAGGLLLGLLGQMLQGWGD